MKAIPPSGSSQLSQYCQHIVLLNVFGQVVMKRDWKSTMTCDIGDLPDGLCVVGVRDGHAVKILGNLLKQ
jgi:hypothetical protein